MKLYWFVFTKIRQEPDNVLVDREKYITVEISCFLFAGSEFIKTAIYLFGDRVNIHYETDRTAYSSHDEGQKSNRQLLLILLCSNA